MVNSLIASRNMFYRQSNLELMSTQPRSDADAASNRRRIRQTESKIFQTGYPREDWQKENLDHPAVLVKQFPTHLFHIFHGDPRRQLEGNTALHQIRSKITRRETIRVNSNLEHPEQHSKPIISTPDMQNTSHLSAWMVLRSGNTELQWRLCQSHGFHARDFAIRRRSHGPIIHSLQGRQK